MNALTDRLALIAEHTQREGTMPKTPAERLHDAILSFAHAVNSDFVEIQAALRKDGQDELVADLEKLHKEWHAASQAAFDPVMPA